MPRAAHADIRRQVDERGRVWFKGKDASELLLRGFDIRHLLFLPDQEIEAYNQCCDRADKLDHRLAVPAEGDAADDLARRQETWHLSERFRHLDVRKTLLARCSSEAERTRVEIEMDMYESRALLPVLRLMFMLVEHFRENNIIWGVGRGSSVASYVLFLIGVHRVNSLGYDLDISEFLR